MRPRAISGVPGLTDNLALTPMERLEKFVRLIVRVPKAEAENRTEKPDSPKARNGFVKAKPDQLK